MEALYTLAAKRIRLALIDFIKDEPSIDLKAACESLNGSMRFGSGYSYPNISKWLPSRRSSVEDGNATVVSITGRAQLIKLFTFLKNCFDEAGFDLLNINNIPVTDWNGDPDNIPFVDETQTRLLAKRRSRPAAAPALSNKDERLVTFENSTPFTKKIALRYVLNGEVAKATIYIDMEGLVYFFRDGVEAKLTGRYTQNIAGVSIISLDTDIQAWHIIYRQGTGSRVYQGALSFYDHKLQRFSGGQCVLWDALTTPDADSSLQELIDLILLPEQERKVKYGKFFISRGDVNELTDISFDTMNIVLGEK